MPAYYPNKYSHGYVTGREFGAAAGNFYFGPPLSFWYKALSFAVIIYGALSLMAVSCH